MDNIAIKDKPLLTLKEASAYTGIGINKLRELSDENMSELVLFVGNRRMLKRAELVKFLLSSYSI